MQDSRDWLPPGGTLGTILEATQRRIPSLDRVAEVAGLFLEGGLATPGLSRLGPRGQGIPSLKAALRRDTVAIIAEVKRKSPSKGELNSTLDAPAQAAAFERGGAAAISVLTEPQFFGGSLDDLQTVRQAVSVGMPVLRKDFHIHRMQLLEARAAHASAVLLIARALAPGQLPELLESVRGLELEAVVEVRDEGELQRALDAGAEIVGVNSRNLETLEVDSTVPERLVPRIPSGVVAIWESGVAREADVRRAADCGADAVLVGSALSRAADPEALVRSLAGVPRQPRG